MLCLDREVDHHDAVLLHQADQHDHADKCVDRQIRFEDQQCQERAESGKRQRRENRQRMDEALVQNAENHVDDGDGEYEQQSESLQRRLECLSRSLIARRHR